MPAGDRTGPLGRGPMTGRAAGYCADYGAPGWANPIPRCGFGPGWGRSGGWGRGWRHRNWVQASGAPGWLGFGCPPGFGAPPAYAAPSRKQETEFLKEQAEWLRQELDAIGQRLEELGKEQ
jgi:hypothetical protein